MHKRILIFFLAVLSLTLPSCQKSNGAVWEDTKTVGRYINRKSRRLLRRDGDSRLVDNREELSGPIEEEFIPLADSDLQKQYAEKTAPQPKSLPGSKGSSVPTIEHFIKPTADLAAVFQTLYFHTDEHILREANFYEAANQISAYLKKHPSVYLFVEGHCDERASEAYNLALGTKRANFIRSYLIRNGINPNRIYTISFGKEMPIALGHNASAWAKNRRAEFKIYKK